jgi:hypothetical protein
MLGAFLARVQQWQEQEQHACGLPFAQLLSQSSIEHALGPDQTDLDAPVYRPWVTLWMFLSQTLSADHSCREAVARLLAYRTAQNQPACSTKTGAYCIARRRLPLTLVENLVRQTGEELHRAAPASWRPHGRTVKVIDGTTIALPDTPANTAAFGKSTNQHRASNFPLLRLVTLFCLASGAVIAADVAAYCGKKTSELSLFRRLWNVFIAGDLLLGDHLYCTFADVAQLMARGIDIVTTGGPRQLSACTRQTQLGEGDWLVAWRKPRSRPEGWTAAEFTALPPTLSLRWVRVPVSIPGFRTQCLEILTTLVDAQVWTRDDLAQLYRTRWQAELNLRSLKTTMQLEMLRCQSPSLVRKDLWVGLLAYNLLRGVMGLAAVRVGTQTCYLSFQATRQLFRSFSELLTLASAALEGVVARLLTAIAQHPVGDRPDRTEPRKQKRRPKPYPFLKATRQQEQTRCRYCN